MGTAKKAKKKKWKGGRSPAREVCCPTCGASIGYACQDSAGPCVSHPERERVARELRAVKPRPRKTGANKARLTYTATRSPDIREREAAVRAVKPVIKSYDHSLATWWWTIARRASECHECSTISPKGEIIAYRHSDKRVLCSACVLEHQVEPKHSKATKKELSREAVG